ncbi:MAG: hypothetical protein CML12_04465 [Puniceicoccaceae bacterium]|nr:hypothetical protein [Puniceicoccaceae bacterium]
MKRKTLTLLALCTISVTALLAVPSTINYQGLISDSEGRPIESITNSISVGLFASESDEGSLYTESFNNVDSDASGVYSIQIGDSNLQALLEGNSELWLELTINGETLTPRQQVHSVPYALHAESANRLVNAETSSISGDLSVSGNTALSGNVNVSNSLSVSGSSTFGQDILVNGRVEGQDARFDFMDVMGPLDVRGRLMTEEINVHGDLEMHGFRANFEYAEEVRVPTPDQANEATNKAYVDSADTTLQANIDAEAVARAEGDSGITSGNTVFTGNPSFTGAKALPSGQTDWASQYHELMPWNIPAFEVPQYATTDVSGLFNADVINAEKMLRVGDMYITENEIRSDFGMVHFRDIFVNGMMRVDGMLEVRGDLFMDGYRANFEYAEEVRVPTPDQANEATNKAYVDSVVVPSGGLIAWPAANPIPSGWSNPGLAAPMANHIWIQKN